MNSLLRMGVTHVATFIPWQAVESDISHTLVRFLQAVSERKMTALLILTPEVGVHYANSGLPKDIFNKPENTAKHPGDGPVPVSLPPNAFTLPSLSSPEFTKRYHNFLSRMDTILADIGKSQPQLLASVTSVLTGSFWKYYRSARSASQNPKTVFGGLAGDYSSCAELAYRQQLENYYNQREFMYPNPSSANRWKTRAMEELNRRWFSQQSEDVFRNRSTQFVRKKASDVSVAQVELFTPEADPGYQYSQFFQLLSGKSADFNKLSDLVDEASTRASCVGNSRTASFVHWTSMGGFATLSDPEKQFLILKSLLLMGGQGGGMLIDESQWFNLSNSFRSRAEALARSLSHQEMTLSTQSLYLTAHLWSSSAAASGNAELWGDLWKQTGIHSRMVASVDYVMKDREAKLLLVDPSYIMTRETIQRLTDWARTGRVVVMPRNAFYSEAARTELETVFAQNQNPQKVMNINLGIPYQLHSLDDGKLVIYELPESANAVAWQRFVQSVLSVAEIKQDVGSSDARLNLISLVRKEGGLGLFILNGGSTSVAADILFSGEVTVSDLALSLTSEQRAAQRTAQQVDNSEGSDPSFVPSNRFGLEVPPCGVLPVAVHGMGVEAEERKAAALTSDLMKTHAIEAARNELAGFNESDDFEATWS
ncbi:MAG: DUF4350 domain-containing protein [Methylotenera sp.]|nr:DUF4350 domain-containing protein [Oligoflexia bacterium]